MLVLKLKVGDRVEIGEGVILECRHVSPGTLRLAIAAPANMGIANSATPIINLKRVMAGPPVACHPSRRG